jgi:hypothetical protein
MCITVTGVIHEMLQVRHYVNNIYSSSYEWNNRDAIANIKPTRPWLKIVDILLFTMYVVTAYIYNEHFLSIWNVCKHVTTNIVNNCIQINFNQKYVNNMLAIMYTLLLCLQLPFYTIYVPEHRSAIANLYDLDGSGIESGW